MKTVTLRKRKAEGAVLRKRKAQTAVAAAGIHVGLQEALEPRPASNALAASSTDPAPRIDELPANVGQGNMMLNSCVVGRQCDPGGLSSTLSVAGVDAIVVATTTAVTEYELVFTCLSRLASATMPSQTWRSHKRSGLIDRAFFLTTSPQ